MKRYLVLIILLLASWGCSRPQGFTLKKILSKHPNDPKWDVPLPKEGDDIQSYFMHPYTYLASGKHCYAFKSEDGQYVLKFFKQKHMQTQSLVDYLPLPAQRLFYPMERIKRRAQEREESFTSYKIAYVWYDGNNVSDVVVSESFSTLSGAIALTAGNDTQTSTSATGVITQIHVLVGANSSQAGTSGTGSIA